MGRMELRASRVLCAAAGHGLAAGFGVPLQGLDATPCSPLCSVIPSHCRAKPSLPSGEE